MVRLLLGGLTALESVECGLLLLLLSEALNREGKRSMSNKIKINCF